MPPPYRVGEIVWAKIKGFPSWPAIIQDPKEAVDYQGGKVPKGKKVHYFVRFFVTEDASNSVAWTAVDDIMDFGSEVQNMRLQANNKGGKTYKDLKLCIDKAEEAHQIWLEDIQKNPEKATAAVMSAGTSSTPPASIGSDKQPSSSSKSEKKQSNGSKKGNTASESEPEGKFASGTGINQPQQKITLKLPKNPTGSASKPASSNNASGKKRTAESESAADSETDGTSTPSRATNGQSASKRKVIPTAKVADNAQQKKAQAASPARTSSNQPKQQPSTADKKSSSNKSQGSTEAIDKAKKISLGLMGSFDDHRTIRIARQLLTKGVRVRIWEQSGSSASTRELQEAKAERVSDGEKLFEDSDLVFLSATSQQQVSALLSGQEHVIRKIRPAQAGKVKGVCVFSNFGEDESEELKARLSPKNLEYLECAWLGGISADKEKERSSLRLIAGGSRRLFEQTLKPLCDVLGSGPEGCTFLSEDVGVVNVVKSAVTMAHNVALAGMVEAVVFAQKHGTDLSLLQAPLTAVLADFSLMTKVRNIVQFQPTKEAQGKNPNIFRESMVAMRDAVRLASYSTKGPASVTPLASCVLDMFKTDFVTYRYERQDDEEEQSSKTGSSSVKEEMSEEGEEGKGATTSEGMSNGESSKETTKIGAEEDDGKKTTNGDEAAGEDEEEKVLKMDI
ncbi:hypothetical protein RvY_17004 [Ramazzottius varieornatus]|uniref:PWWP domain-containing protein n=1 Tax=Ramazzottius varieornatus TaxID=947166 RepID=A0A1D1W4P2_RAMVA|nr:hypothetical protein RvY_17004 [Ramazzottius varieornatus]